MGNLNKINEIIFSDKDVFSAVWDCETGFEIVSDGCASLNKNNLKNNGLEDFLESVEASDKPVLMNYINKLKHGIVGAEEYSEVKDNCLSSCIKLEKAAGGYTYFKIKSRLLKNDIGEITRILYTIRELESEEKYRYELAQYITNDKNPKFFLNGVNEIMDKYPNENFAVIQFDVANFKIINSQYGEKFGDDLLSFFITSLNFICNKDQIYTRLTADVFMIFTIYKTEADILKLIDEVNDRLNVFNDIKLKLYFGVCFVTDKNKPLRYFGDAAARARQAIKGNALKYVEFYDESLSKDEGKYKYIVDNMVSALENNEFVMYLQPKFSISSNKLFGAEALVRWNNKKFGIISPNDFLSVFEKNGFIIKMDYFIWEEACKTIREWMDEGLEVVPISVNMSRKHFNKTESIDVLKDLTKKYNIDKKYLEIELTETIEGTSVKDGISHLKAEGFTLLMDDFGSGFSSLNTLKNTTFDAIKIDRMFLLNFSESERGKKIVEYTIKMTRDIGLDVIAEGVENLEQAEFLEKCGCDKAQGYYYAKPMPADDFKAKYL